MRRLAKMFCGLCVGIIAFVSLSPVEVRAAETEIEIEETEEVLETEETTEMYPLLVIESYEIVNGAFERGSECTLRVHIENIGTDYTALTGNIVMHSSYIYPVFGKTNQINFGNVEPGERISVDFDVNLDKIVTGPNPIEFMLGWSDKNEVRYSNNVQISPALLEEIGFEVLTVKMPDTVYGSQNTTLSVSYENTGVESLQNVYMILEGDLAQGVQVVELEDLSAKKKGMVDYSLDLLNMGENHIQISFKYEDRNGTEYKTEIVEKTVTVTDQNYITPAPQKTDVKGLLEEYRLFVLCGIVAVLLCIPFLIGLMKRGGKKR